MNSQLIKALNVKMQPVAILLTDNKPEDGLHFKEGSMGGCVAVLLVAASKKNRLACANRSIEDVSGHGKQCGRQFSGDA